MFQEAKFKRLRSKLAIDPMMMDDELIQHPSLVQEAAEIAADAVQIRDAYEQALKIEIAEAANRLRVPGEDGKLPAENRITSQITLNVNVREASLQLEESVHDLRYWQALVDSLKEKGSSLKRIAELTIAGYLAPNMVRRKEITEARNAVTSGNPTSRRVNLTRVE